MLYSFLVIRFLCGELQAYIRYSQNYRTQNNVIYFCVFRHIRTTTMGLLHFEKRKCFHEG